MRKEIFLSKMMTNREFKVSSMGSVLLLNFEMR